MENIQEKNGCWGLSLWHLLISLFVPSKSPLLYSLKNYSNPVILRRHPEFAAGSESHYWFLLSLTVRFIFRLSHTARKRTGGRAIPLQHLQETFWNLRRDHSRNSSKEERKKKILDLYCRKNCHSYEIRNCADKATNSFAVSLRRGWPTPAHPQPLPATHTHTHTHTTLQKHDRSRLGWFDFREWLAEIHKPCSVLKSLRAVFFFT